MEITFHAASALFSKDYNILGKLLVPGKSTTDYISMGDMF